MHLIDQVIISLVRTVVGTFFLCPGSAQLFNSTRLHTQLTVEDYVHIMSQLVNDYRFTLYNVCYKRVLMAWIIMGFIILLCILFSGLSQLSLFGAGIGWLMVNAAAIFFCMWIKIRVSGHLAYCAFSLFECRWCQKIFIKCKFMICKVKN